MPGSVANAAPATVFPASLSSAFSHSREFLVAENEYANGENQRRVRVATSRKRWTLTKTLTAAEMATLVAFWRARSGPGEAFYFYDLGATHDPTGASVVGRYTVRFESQWSEAWNMALGSVEVALVELA